MKTTVVAIAVLGLSVAFGASPAAAQAQWASMDVQGGGKQFQLNNDDGSAIVMLCLVNGQAVAFQFPEPIESADRATVRGTPGGQENVQVTQVAEQLLQVTGARGRDFMLDLLQSATRLSVRAAGQNLAFEIFGSESTVRECIQLQEALIGDPRRQF
ncbi:MAG: hypothetical protein F4X11_25920 [Acidobacteria bacterium]|nr:hypothetical protein [Acidobacteriota bacterium]